MSDRHTKAVAVREPRMDALLLYVYREGHDMNGPLRMYFRDEGEPLLVRPGEEGPMYCRPIPTYIAEALGLALAPRPEFGERHLDDAIAVRDRLLALIETDYHPRRS